MIIVKRYYEDYNRASTVQCHVYLTKDYSILPNNKSVLHYL